MSKIFHFVGVAIGTKESAKGDPVLESIVELIEKYNLTEEKAIKASSEIDGSGSDLESAATFMVELSMAANYKFFHEKTESGETFFWFEFNSDPKWQKPSFGGRLSNENVLTERSLETLKTEVGKAVSMFEDQFSEESVQHIRPRIGACFIVL